MLKLERNALLLNLAPLTRVSSVKGLPIYEFVHIRHRKDSGKLTLRCMDGDVSLSACYEPEIRNEEDFDTCVPARLLLDMLKQLPSGEITLSLSNDVTNLLIDWNTGKSHLYTTSWTDFPDEPKIEEEHRTIRIKQDELLKAIKNVIGATADDNTIRPALASICFDISDGQLNLVASDAHQMICSTIPAAFPDGRFLLPEKSAQTLKGILFGQEDVDIIFDEKHVKFSTGEFTMTSNLVASKYPNYKNVIPKDTAGKVAIEKDLLIKSVRRMSVFANQETNLLTFHFNENGITITGTDLTLGMTGKDVLQCRYNGPEITIGVKIPYLMNILSSIESKHIEVGVSADNRPMVLKPSAENDQAELVLAVVVPVNTNKK